MTGLFSVLILASSLGLIISVAMQEASSEGLGAVGGNATDSLWGKSRGTSREGMLRRITIISSIIFIISALVLAA